jgi:hypothetical protein
VAKAEVANDDPFEQAHQPRDERTRERLDVSLRDTLGADDVSLRDICSVDDVSLRDICSVDDVSLGDILSLAQGFSSAAAIFSFCFACEICQWQ